MRPLIDDTILLEGLKQATTNEEITNQNETRRATTNNNQEVLPKSLNINQGNKQEIVWTVEPEQFEEVDF